MARITEPRATSGARPASMVACTSNYCSRRVRRNKSLIEIAKAGYIKQPAPGK